MDLSTIYGHLLAGTELVIEFTNKREAETFRIAFYRFRTRQAALMASLGEPLEENWKFSFTYLPATPAAGNTVPVKLKMTRSASQMSYRILSMDTSES